MTQFVRTQGGGWVNPEQVAHVRREQDTDFTTDKQPRWRIIADLTSATNVVLGVYDDADAAGELDEWAGRLMNAAARSPGVD